MSRQDILEPNSSVTRVIWDWIAASGLTLMLLGGYISSSPVIGRPLHLYGLAIVVVAIILRIIRVGIVPGAGMLLALMLSALPAFLESPVTEYGMTKISMMPIIILSAMGGLWLLRSDQQRRVWFWTLLLFGVGVTILAVLFPENDWRLSLVGTNYIGSGRIVALAMCVSGLLVVLNLEKKTVRILLAILTPVLVYFAFSTGSRGPFVASFIALIVVAVLRRGIVVHKAVLVGGVGAILGLFALQLFPVDSYISSRFLDTGTDQSSSVRIELWREALSIASSNPTGVGWGNFMSRSAMDYEYPHNIFAEVLAEGGWLPLALLVVVTAVSAARLWEGSNNSTAAAMLGLLVFFTINSLVSSDINSNRAMFTVLFAAWAIPSNTASPKASSSPGMLSGNDALLRS